VWRRLSEVAQDALDEGAVGWRLLRPWQVRFEADLEPRLPLRCECLRRQATDVKRLAYTRTQAAEALGVSRSTFDRRVLPLLETLDMPWGPQLVPVDELTRFVRERRRPARGHVQTALPGRPTAIPEELVRDIQSEHAKGKSLRRIARDLNASQTPTAHGGAQWWPSTVRAVLARSIRLETSQAGGRGSRRCAR
jgi:Recombinase